MLSPLIIPTYKTQELFLPLYPIQYFSSILMNSRLDEILINPNQFLLIAIPSILLSLLSIFQLLLYILQFLINYLIHLFQYSKQFECFQSVSVDINGSQTQELPLSFTQDYNSFLFSKSLQYSFASINSFASSIPLLLLAIFIIKS